MHMLAGYDPAPPQHLNPSCSSRTHARLAGAPLSPPHALSILFTVAETIMMMQEIEGGRWTGGVAARR